MRAISNKLYKVDNFLLRLMVLKVNLCMTNLAEATHSTLPPWKVIISFSTRSLNENIFYCCQCCKLYTCYIDYFVLFSYSWAELDFLPDEIKRNRKQHHAWYSMINRNKIKSGNVFNQPTISNNKNIHNVERPNETSKGENGISSDDDHQRQLRSVISAAALTSAQTGKQNKYLTLANIFIVCLIVTSKRFWTLN